MVALSTVRGGWLPMLLATGVAVGLLAVGTPAAAAQPAPRVTVIVRLQADGDVDAQLQRALQEDARLHFRYRAALRGFAVDVPARAVEVLRRLPQVVDVELDTPITTTDTQQLAEWGLDRIDQRALPLSNSYSYPAAGAGVAAYVVDTGILAEHTDFGDRVKPGFSAVDDDRGTADCAGHGTHVAGTIAGTTYGVAKQATLVPVRVLDCDGTGSTSEVIAGLDWVVANHTAGDPAVANMSLGGSGSNSMDAAVRAAIQDGVTVGVAAGNDNGSACNKSPARVPDALTVAASTRSDARASFSNYGDCVDLFAPGENVRSDSNAGTSATAVKSGTSMAAPHVTGAAAVLLSRRGNLSPADVANELRTAATPGVITNAGSKSPNKLVYVETPGAPRSLGITNPGSQTSVAGTRVNLTMRAVDGTPPYRWSTSGLPAGLTIDPGTGMITGTPTTPAAGPVIVTATDAVALTATTTFTWTITAAPVACAGAGQRLVNPGFESANQAWTASAGVIGQVGPTHGGSWNARLAGRGVRGTTTLEQTVSIPTGCRTYRLAFWLRTDSTETSRTRKDDTLVVSLGSTKLATYSNVDKSATYVERTFDVSRQAGRTVGLTFTAKEDSNHATTFAVDDVALTAG